MQSTARALAALLATMTVVGALPVAQAGGHMSGYVLTPEHDDTGRSDEPNFAGASGVLGVSVVERSVDDNNDGVGEVYPTNLDVAPGCTDGAGRQPSGTCWLYWMTGVVGTQGMPGNAAPGDFTPTKGDRVRVMDLLGTLQVVRAYVDINRKLDDSGLRAALSGVDSNFGGQVIPASAGFTMWHGVWQDKNGNGVIDADGANDFNAGQQARNEFQWEGQCKTFTGNPSEVPDWVCHIQPRSDIYVWAFPGNHHASTMGGNGLFLPTDAPGMQVLCFANAVAQNIPSGTAGITTCPSRIQDIEENDDTLDIGAGDPLLGIQNSIRPDFTMAHRSGDPNINTRHLVAGLGWAIYHYDNSLLTSYTTIASSNPDADTGARQFNPATGDLVDVDSYRTFSPAAEDLLANTVKPTARSNWVTLRDSYIPFNSFVDGRLNSHMTGLGATNPVVGSLDDQLLDPGFCHEPNHALDVYPQVVRGAASCAGFFNSYAGYQGLRPDGIGHLFADGQLFRTEPLIRPQPPGGLPAPPVPAGPFVVDSLSPLLPLRSGGSDDPANHVRTLTPGLYDFLGGMGAWHDKTQRNVEDALLASFNYVSAPDGWVGNVVNTTGQFRYRDYPAGQDCTANGVSGPVHEYAQCHPYADGTFSQPNDFATDDGEVGRGCGSIGGPVGTLRVVPVSGTWTFPVFVYRSIEELTVGDVSQLQDFTGTGTTITLSVRCAQNTLVNAGDYLVLPFGNLGGAVRTIWTASVSTVPGETVVDVDEYAAFGL